MLTFHYSAIWEDLKKGARLCLELAFNPRWLNMLQKTPLWVGVAFSPLARLFGRVSHQTLTSTNVPWQPLGPVAALMLLVYQHVQQVVNHGLVRSLHRLFQRLMMVFGLALLIFSKVLILGYWYLAS